MAHSTGQKENTIRFESAWSEWYQWRLPRARFAGDQLPKVQLVQTEARTQAKFGVLFERPRDACQCKIERYELDCVVCTSETQPPRLTATVEADDAGTAFYKPEWRTKEKILWDGDYPGVKVAVRVLPKLLCFHETDASTKALFNR